MAFPRTRKSFVSFNGGELSPKMDARNDTEKYQSGCRQLQNFLPLPHGGAIRRRGFEFIAASKYDDDSKPARALRFQFSQSDGIIIEVGDLYMRFFTREGPIMDPSDDTIPYEIVSPYTSAQAFAIQTAQINDVVFISHPLIPPYKLIRLANDNWTLAAAVFDKPALLDINVTATTLALGATTGTGIALVASTATFLPGHVGSTWQIAHRRDANVISTPITSSQTVALGTILGNWTVNTYGTWSAKIEIQVQTVAGSWETVRTYSSSEDANFTDSGQQLDNAVPYQAVITWSANTGSPGPRFVFGIVDGLVYGTFKITAVTDSTHATVDIIDDAYSTDATIYWSEAAWSDVRGYPTSLCFFQQRLWFAGTSYQPQTFWGSITGSYQDFTLGSNDDSAVAFTLSSNQRSQILWMVGQKKLVLGTSGGIYAAYGDELEASITATKPPLILLQSQYPMAYERAVLVNSAILAVQSSGLKLREMVFDGSQGIYTANDLTVLSDHIGAGGILTPCYQMDRDSLFWAVTGEGNLISMTYEKEQNVLAWARHVTTGIFESCDTIKGEIDDEVWVSVRRKIGGTYKRFIERMKGYYNPSIDPMPDMGAGADPWNPTDEPVRISFSEQPLGTVNPTYVFDDNVVTFAGAFLGQTVSGGILLGSPTAPLALNTAVQAFIAEDGAQPDSPVLSGTPLYNGPIVIKFSNNVSAVGVNGGYFNNIASMNIVVYDRDGNALAALSNSVIGIEFLGLDAGAPIIAGMAFFISGDEPAGYTIDSVKWK